jgi:small GTP-binding protein
MKTIKIGMLGDTAVGKTSLINTIENGSYKESSEFFEKGWYTYNPIKEIIKYNEKEYNVILYDKVGHEDYDIIRPLNYSDTNCFIICFSIVNQKSFENITEKWVKGIKNFQKKYLL